MPRSLLMVRGPYLCGPRVPGWIQWRRPNQLGRVVRRSRQVALNSRPAW